MRITGLATGMDVDAIVEATMKSYRIRIDETQQNKEIVEIKQKLYRDVINDSRDFYNKYFDVSKKDSILLSSNWTTVDFNSSDKSVVSVTGNSEAKAGNYTITGSVATAAKAIVSSGTNEGDKITINGKEFELTGNTAKNRADNLNTQLKEAGINVSVRYSDFAGSEAGNGNGFIFESTVLGKDGTFTIGGTSNNIGVETSGKNATAATITGFSIDDIKSGKSIKIGDKTIELELKDEMTDDDIVKTINTKLAEEKIAVAASKDKEGNLTFTSKTLGKDSEIPDIEINNIKGTKEDGQDAISASSTMTASDLNDKKISVNGTIIDLSKAGNDSKEDYINKVLKEQGKDISAKLDNETGKITFTANKAGAGEVKVNIIEGSTVSESGTDANIVIKDSKGGVYTHTGNTNKITLDGITFDFKGEIPEEGVKITGENNVEKVKDKLVEFINDYNKLIENLNTLTSTKNDSSYKPLTADQKKEMSEDEIRMWNERVEKGQLYKDSDISRIANSLKSTMRSYIDGDFMEKFGISPVKDYQSNLNGTFTIDEEKLTAALEEDVDQVMNFFIGTNSESGQKGIAQQLKDVLYNETVTTGSALIKKAGIEGSATMSNNVLTKQIEEYSRKMKDLEVDFSRRESALYSKWAIVETMMNELNSQQSSLLSMLG